MTQSSVRVAFVSPHALAGGAERYLEMLLERLGPQWIAGVVALQDGWLVERLRARSHPVVVVPTGRRAGIFPAALRLRRELRALEPQVVHANGVKAALVTGLAMVGSGVPVVFVKHDFAWDGPLVHLTATLCGRVVGVSAAVVAVLRRRRRIRVHVIPNGLEPEAVDRAAGRTRLEALSGAGPGDPIVVALGRITAVKGILDLVEAANALRARVPAARVVIAGADDPHDLAYAAAVRARVAELGIQDEVRLVGHQDRALELVAGADAVAVATADHGTGLVGEGFGLVALEALAAGTPVVGYAAGALPEVVGDAGVLVAPQDPRALALALAGLLGDDERRAALAAAGAERARARFGLDRVAREMAAVYAAAARG